MKKIYDELVFKVDMKKNFEEILKCVVNKENKLQKEVQEIVNNKLNKDNIVDFFEYCIYNGDLGQFYTPKSLVQLCYEIGKEYGKDVYEPTIGSGNLISPYYKNGCNIYGQEYDLDAYELCKMLYSNIDIAQGDTLKEPKHLGKEFDVVISNPPYSAKWEPKDDARFNGLLAPKGKADFAFVQHCIHHTKDNGISIIVLPHGPLFRGGAEEKIRKDLIERNLIDAVIGLPDNLFSNTSIPTILLIIKKNKKTKDILFIDASKEYSKQKKINVMEDCHIEKIIKTYKDRKEVDKFSHVATINELEENNYNMNIPRYVDTFEEEEPIDIIAVSKEYKKLQLEEQELREDILSQMEELQGDEDILNALREMIIPFGQVRKKRKISEKINEGQLGLFGED